MPQVQKWGWKLDQTQHSLENSNSLADLFREEIFETRATVSNIIKDKQKTNPKLKENKT